MDLAGNKDNTNSVEAAYGVERSERVVPCMNRGGAHS